MMDVRATEVVVVRFRHRFEVRPLEENSAAARRIVATGYPLGPQLADAITTPTTAGDAARLFDGVAPDAEA